MINMMIRVDALGRRRLLDPRDCLYCRPHPDEAAKILDAHYLGRDKRLADSAIEKLEKLKAKDQ